MVISWSVGTAASLAANVATADDGIVSRVIAGWPALALLIAVKLLSGIMEHGKAVRPVAEADTPGCGTVSPAAPSDSDPEHRPDPLRIAGHPRRRPPRSADSIEDMLPAARALRDGLRTDGRPLTRDALAAHLRGAGHRVGNDRLTQLLAALRDAAAT